MLVSTVCAGVWGAAICEIVTWYFSLPLDMTIAWEHESPRRLRGFLFFVRGTRLRHTKCSKVDFFFVLVVLHIRIFLAKHVYFSKHPQCVDLTVNKHD